VGRITAYGADAEIIAVENLLLFPRLALVPHRSEVTVILIP